MHSHSHNKYLPSSMTMVQVHSNNTHSIANTTTNRQHRTNKTNPSQSDKDRAVSALERSGAALESVICEYYDHLESHGGNQLLEANTARIGMPQYIQVRKGCLLHFLDCCLYRVLIPTVAMSTIRGVLNIRSLGFSWLVINALHVYLITGQAAYPSR